MDLTEFELRSMSKNCGKGFNQDERFKFMSLIDVHINLIRHLRENGTNLTNDDIKCLADIYSEFDKYLKSSVEDLHDIINRNKERYGAMYPYTFEDFINFTTRYLTSDDMKHSVKFMCSFGYNEKFDIKGEFKTLIKNYRDDLFKLYSKYMDAYHNDKNLTHVIESRIKYYDDLILNEVGYDEYRKVEEILKNKNEYIKSILRDGEKEGEKKDK